eukprot:jgi/Ulvmu1/2248/UM013_0095.1
MYWPYFHCRRPRHASSCSPLPQFVKAGAVELEPGVHTGQTIWKECSGLRSTKTQQRVIEQSFSGAKGSTDAAQRTSGCTAQAVTPSSSADTTQGHGLHIQQQHLLQCLVAHRGHLMKALCVLDSSVTCLICGQPKSTCMWRLAFVQAQALLGLGSIHAGQCANVYMNSNQKPPTMEACAMQRDQLDKGRRCGMAAA